MNTDKLLKAIQILIKEELKEQLPALIKEGVKAEMKKILSETKVAPKPQSKGISMAKAILGDEPIQESVQTKQAPTKQYSKNPPNGAEERIREFNKYWGELQKDPTLWS